MENELHGITREQTHEAFEMAHQQEQDQSIGDKLLAEQDMVSVLSLIELEHQDYVSKTYQSVAVEIDGHKFMLNPRQLVPKRARILQSKVRSSDVNGKQQFVPVGFGMVAGGQHN